jgi:hypothetical protein
VRARLDGVEIKANVADIDMSDAMGALELNDADAFSIWFYDDLTPGVAPLPLLNAGLIFRIRVKANGDVDSTVKLRPCRRSQLTGAWLSTESHGDFEFSVEEDRSGIKNVLAASCRVQRDASSVTSLNGPPYPLAKLLSERQQDLLANCAPMRVNAAELTALGPIDATRWKQVGGDDFADLDARAEQWTIEGQRFLEISVRANLDEADKKSRRLQRLITERGIVLDSSEDSKTRRALTTLATRVDRRQ